MSFCSSWSSRTTATSARPDELAKAPSQPSLARCSWVVVGLLLLVALLVSCDRETGRTPIRGTSVPVGHRAREGVYELVATADDVKMVTWLRRDGGRLRVRGGTDPNMANSAQLRGESFSRSPHAEGKPSLLGLGAPKLNDDCAPQKMKKRLGQMLGELVRIWFSPLWF